MFKNQGHNGSSKSDVHLLSEGPPCATLRLSLHTRQIATANSTSGSMKESPTLKPCAQQQVKIPLVGYREGKDTITGKFGHSCSMSPKLFAHKYLGFK